MALQFGNKTANHGATSQGTLSAIEFNQLVDQVNQNEQSIHNASVELKEYADQKLQLLESLQASIETMNNAIEQAKREAKQAADRSAIAGYRTVVETELARVMAEYAKAFAHPSPPWHLKRPLEQAKITHAGNAERLLTAIQEATTGALTSEKKRKVDTAYQAYRTSLSTLQGALQEATLPPMSAQKIDARGLDPDTYYPVTFSSVPRNTPSRLSLASELGEPYGIPPWSRHSSGFSAYCEWETNGSGWGAFQVRRSVVRSYYSFTRDNIPPYGNIGQITQDNCEYIYVRGGGVYEMKIVGAKGVSIELHTQAWKHPSYNVTLPLLNRVDPVEDIESRLGRISSETKEQ